VQAIELLQRIRNVGEPFNRFGDSGEEGCLVPWRDGRHEVPRRLIRHLETPELPLQTLEAIHRLRGYLEELETACIIKARELGASPTDIGEALGITRQAVYNRLHNLELRAKTDPNFVFPDLRAEETVEIPHLDAGVT
jgi:hypothetical protein